MNFKSVTPKARLRKSAAWIAIACVIALGASACGAVPENSLTPTPTTLMGVLPLNGGGGGTATETSTASSSSLPSGGSSAPGQDACALVTQAEAEAVLGQPVVSVTPGTDSTQYSSTLYFCTFLDHELALVVSEVDLGSPEAAVQALQTSQSQMISDDPGTVSTALTNGPGDQAYWTTNEHAAQVTVLIGNVVFSVVVGGDVGDPSAFQAGLLALAASVSGNF